MGAAINTSVNALDTEDIDEDEDEVYKFTGEEIIDLANHILELETRVELQEDMINNLEEQIKEYDNKVESYENEVIILEEKIVNLQTQIGLYEGRIEQQEETFEKVMLEVDRTIELYEESDEALKESLEYYRDEAGITLADRAQWILIGAGGYAILNSILN